jgi:glyceraldehyde-3-phosphate dehydrogenase/erythrose-4-phosphate dehydrogenase
MRFDSVHGRFPGEVKVSGDTIDVGTGPIMVHGVRNPAELPHKDLGVEIALECHGQSSRRRKKLRRISQPAPSASSFRHPPTMPISPSSTA